MDGAAGLVPVGPASPWPHFRQNLAPGRFSSAQLGQMLSSFAPHSSQKAASVAFSCLQLGHRMPGLPARALETVETEYGELILARSGGQGRVSRLLVVYENVTP